jgi:hypothetical protein
MRTVVLKLGATVLTILTTVVSAAYVTAHLKNSGAPLQPTVIRDASSGVMLGPSVQPGNVQPVTSTYAS